MPPKEKKTKEQIAKAAAAGGKSKKKKWSKGKVRDKLNNMVLFDKATLDKFNKEVCTLSFVALSSLVRILSCVPVRDVLCVAQVLGGSRCAPRERDWEHCSEVSFYEGGMLSCACGPDPGAVASAYLEVPVVKLGVSIGTSFSFLYDGAHSATGPRECGGCCLLDRRGTKMGSKSTISARMCSFSLFAHGIHT